MAGCAKASDFYELATRSDFPAGMRPVVQAGQQINNILPLVSGQVRLAQGLFQGPFRAPFMIHLLVEFGLQHEGFVMTVVLGELGPRKLQGIMTGEGTHVEASAYFQNRLFP